MDETQTPDLNPSEGIDADTSPLGASDSSTSTLLIEEEAPQASEQRASGSSFAEMLVAAGMLSTDQVATAQEAAHREKVPLWQILIRDGLVMSQDLVALTAMHMGLSMVDLRNQTIDPKAVAALPEQVSRRHTILPIQATDSRLTVAMTDPTDLQLIQNLTARTQLTIEPVVATPEDILEHIDITYRLIENPSVGTGDGGDPTGAAEASRVTSSILKDAPPAKIVDLLLEQAIQDRTSDVHIEPTETRLRVRFRIDGILHDIMSLPLDLHLTIISRLKIMAGMNIAERRRPQDGQFTVDFQNRKVDVRAAISNSVTGEMAVLRLLDKGFTLLGLNQLGMGTSVLEQYRRLLRLPYGMIVICGPTGSGKSTTLYASLLQMDRVEQNVISLEDPVEYRISDTNQTQVNTEAGITFATQLRSVLRLDPDVILVGEIRDEETAVIATQAALTGHLVLTSIHANDSVGGLVRLRDLGVAPYLIASSVAGVVAQRMVRVVCTSCQSMTPGTLAEQKAFASVTGEVREQFVYGAGCNMCAQTGYRGRAGTFEVLTNSDTLRRLFLAEASRDQLWEQALKEGLQPLRHDGMQKVKGGVTTPYEVMRTLIGQDS